MVVKQIRLSQQAKEQLSRLKGKTGIQNWNVLCRWALCLSLREITLPPDLEIPADSNVEMSWLVFGGEYHEVYEALIVQRCLDDGLDTSPETLARQFRLHLHRGISYLSATGFIKSITDLFDIAGKSCSEPITEEEQ
jgi:DNA sulfur modification protein DndE